jgi:hypothetical protein
MAPEDTVIFDQQNATVGSCAHALNTDQVFFWQPGWYYIYTNVYHQEACQFTIFMNGAVVAGSTIGSPTGSSQNSTGLMMYIDATDLTTPTLLSPLGFAAAITLVNHTSFVPIITLNGLTGSGSATPQVVATLTMLLLKTA